MIREPGMLALGILIVVATLTLVGWRREHGKAQPSAPIPFDRDTAHEPSIQKKYREFRRYIAPPVYPSTITAEQIERYRECVREWERQHTEILSDRWLSDDEMDRQLSEHWNNYPDKKEYL